MKTNRTTSRIDRANTAATIIDVQERLYPIIHDNELMTRNIVTLIKGLKALDVPILITQQYTKGLGTTIAPIKEALGNHEHIEKMSFSCCGDDGFIDEFERLGRKNIILMGIESHVCVLQTALDLLDKGYTPILIEDCVSSRKPNDKKIAVKRMRSEGAVISTCESILFELTVVSGTEQFKAISKLVK
jgi:nicotinamidase-related amidase